jgi:hypothetical protein
MRIRARPRFAAYDKDIRRVDSPRESDLLRGAVVKHGLRHGMKLKTEFQFNDGIMVVITRVT